MCQSQRDGGLLTTGITDSGVLEVCVCVCWGRARHYTQDIDCSTLFDSFLCVFDSQVLLYA